MRYSFPKDLNDFQVLLHPDLESEKDSQEQPLLFAYTELREDPVEDMLRGCVPHYFA